MKFIDDVVSIRYSIDSTHTRGNKISPKKSGSISVSNGQSLCWMVECIHNFPITYRMTNHNPQQSAPYTSLTLKYIIQFSFHIARRRTIATLWAKRKKGCTKTYASQWQWSQFLIRNLTFVTDHLGFVVV